MVRFAEEEVFLLGQVDAGAMDFSPRTIERLQTGDRLGWIYTDDRDRRAAFLALVAQARATNSRILYFSYLPTNSPDVTFRSIPEVATALAEGTLQILSADSLFLRNQHFSAAEAVSLLERFTANGSIIAVADMTWMFQAGVGPERFADFDARLAQSAAPIAFVAALAKPLYRPSFLFDLLPAFPHLLLDERIYVNTHYLPRRIDGNGDGAPDEVDRVLHSIRALGSVELELESRAERLLQAESALNMFQAVIDSMGDGVFVVDERGSMLFCNKSSESILGYGLMNMPFEERVRAIGNFRADKITPYPAHELPIARAIRGEAVDQEEIFIRNARRPDGVWISVTTRPLRGNADTLSGAVSVFRDITRQKEEAAERVRFEEQLYRAQKLESLGVLAGGIAHDFNNLLMGVLGNADLALMEVSGNKGLHARISQIGVAARRLSDLTKQLLAYSGKGELLRPAISKRAHVQYHLDEKLGTAFGDATQLRQVMMNLITNASDALDDAPGEIVIRTGRMNASVEYLASSYVDDSLPAGNYVFFEVEDSGCGMDEETLTRIFDPFFTTKFTGRGLGLAAVLGIVRRHGGALRVESAPGKGTVFRVLLPANDQGGVVEELGGRERGRGEGLVLLIDDEPAVLEVGEQMLLRAGFSVVTASSGLKAIERFKENRQQLVAIILDMTMPDLSGEEVLARLGPVGAATKIVLSSGYQDLEVANRLAATGAATFLQKPYGSDTLLKTLRQALEGGESDPRISAPWTASVPISS